MRGAIAGFRDPRSFGPIEFDEQGGAVRSVVGTFSLRLDALTPGKTVVLQVRPGAAEPSAAHVGLARRIARVLVGRG